jgi:hypothetical protein
VRTEDESSAPPHRTVRPTVSSRFREALFELVDQVVDELAYT